MPSIKENLDITSNSSNHETLSPEFDKLVTDVEQTFQPLDSMVTGATSASDGQTKKNVQFPPSVINEGRFAADLGGARNLNALTLRYAALIRRAPELFANLEPRAISTPKGQLDKTRLIAGPFAGPDQVAAFCRSIRLNLTIECSQAKYQGVPIYSNNR